MFFLPNLFRQLLNARNRVQRHFAVLLLLTMIVINLLSLPNARAASTDNMLILGDSLSAGYRLPIADAWPSLLHQRWQAAPASQSRALPAVINASISGDTSAQGLARLPALLQQHQPRWVVIELGANDGLRGFATQEIVNNLSQIIQLIKAANAEPILMQIRLPPNYGRRYTEAFSAIYPALAEHASIPLIPFFMEQVAMKPEWMQEDGLHPTAAAQAFIAEWADENLAKIILRSIVIDK